MGELKNKPIGVLDSGLGGLTLVRELERLLPHESIVYFGDNANCPFGNRPKSEILGLSFAMLNFLKQQDVKIAAIACNTISVLIEELSKPCDFPVVSIIEAASKFVAGMKLKQVGIVATEFTIKQGLYETLIRNQHPHTQVYGQSSRTLAALIDAGNFTDPATKAEVESLVSTLRQARPELKHIVLGCTHYPIVLDLFEQAAADISFINPAQAQAEAVKTLLLDRGLLADGSADSKPASLDIFTSGEKAQYEAALKKLEISRPAAVQIRKI